MTDSSTQIEQLMRASIADALDKNKEQLFKKVVDEVLDNKNNYYGKTFLDERISCSIRNLAEKIINSEIEKRLPEIQAVVLTKLDDEWWKVIISKISTGLAENMKINFSVTKKDYED